MTIEQFVALALAEDVGSGDHTSLACIPSQASGKAQLVAKETGVLSGREPGSLTLKTVDQQLNAQWHLQDGDVFVKGDIVGTLTGPSHSILTAERVMLNMIQRMSGIATKTRKMVDLVEPFGCKILDTRKTTPLLRTFEKAAVVHGGGVNHRMGLYDMMMIKDNHIDFAGGIRQAIQKCQDYNRKNQLSLEIIVEARDLAEVDKILSCKGVRRILLDNFTPKLMKQAVVTIGDQCETEASGGITESTIVEYAKTGVNYISVGALTHSYSSVDLSLKAV